MRKLSKKPAVLGHGEQLLIGDDNHGVDTLKQFLEARAAPAWKATLAFKDKGLRVIDGDSEDAHLACERSNDRGGTRACASAEAGGDEHPCQRLSSASMIFSESSSAARRAPRQGLAPAPWKGQGRVSRTPSCNLNRRMGTGFERLDIGIGRR